MNRHGRSRNARINQAIKHAELLLDTLKRLQGHSMDKHIDDKDGWFDSRTDLETLVQCVHEANAYNNVMGSDSDHAGSGRRKPLATTNIRSTTDVPGSQRLAE